MAQIYLSSAELIIMDFKICIVGNAGLEMHLTNYYDVIIGIHVAFILIINCDKYDLLYFVIYNACYLNVCYFEL